MELNIVSIRRYRSFDREVTIPISRFTVLTGPNNLGKSNVLKALEVFFASLRSSRAPRLTSRYYNLEDDYPKRYEGRRGRRWPTRISVGLSFSDVEQANANDELGISIPNTVNL